MKVCFILYSFFPLLVSPLEYSRKLVALGVEVDIICLGEHGEPVLDNCDGARINRIIFSRDQIKKRSSVFQFIRKAKQKLQLDDYHIVHIVYFRGCSLLRVGFGGRGVKWVLDLRSGSIVSNRFRAELNDLKTRIESHGFKNLISISEAVGRKVYGKKRRFSVVPLGADIEKFSSSDNADMRGKLAFPEDSIVVVFISSLAKERNPLRVVEAFVEAHNRCENLRLLVIGAGSERESMKNLAAGYGAGDVVVFTGYVDYNIIQEYLAAADIGLSYIPAVRQYDLQPPLKTAEYLASGLATIATDTKGNREFIREYHNGLLCEDDVQSISRKILELAEDEALRLKLGDYARKSIRTHDWINIVKEHLLPFYQSLG